jgi:hypothetical protein
MRCLHYQTLEPVGTEELGTIRRIRERFNDGKGFWERIKLWKKSDIVNGLEPQDSRWGFSRVRGERARLQLLQVIGRMSRATPSLTWVVYDDGDGGRELVIRGGRPVA